MNDTNKRPLNIFVHRASEHLTDYDPHGDGLICFSLLDGLQRRGHRIFAYTNSIAINQPTPNLTIKTAQHKIPANSLAAWEHSWRAEHWLNQLLHQQQPIDLVWRLHPYGVGCPYPPRTFGLPLLVGPLFHDWPQSHLNLSKEGQPRFGIGLGGLVAPMAECGWQRTLQKATMVICPTKTHAQTLQKQLPQAQVVDLPVIVDLPSAIQAQKNLERKPGFPAKPLQLVFVANLVANKNPQVFCDIIRILQQSGIPTEGTILGDGSERPVLEAYCNEIGIASSVRFEGKVPNSAVYAYLQAADFLISTSYGEPYGRSIAEAMAVGTPGVCHSSGGPAEFITNGADGLLITELNAATYATEISRIYHQPELWQKLSQGAKQTASQWTSEIIISRMEQYLTQVIKSKI